MHPVPFTEMYFLIANYYQLLTIRHQHCLTLLPYSKQNKNTSSMHVKENRFFKGSNTCRLVFDCCFFLTVFKFLVEVHA